MFPTVEIVEADLNNPVHQAGIVSCLNQYAMDEMGAGKPLPADVQAAIVPGLQQVADKHVFLALAGQKVVGLAVCLLGFSTFAGKPRLNVHDLAVDPGFRGQGIGRRLMDRVSAAALDAGCSAVSLEVRKDNTVAQGLYRSLGFQDAASPMEFWVKPL